MVDDFVDSVQISLNNLDDITLQDSPVGFSYHEFDDAVVFYKLESYLLRNIFPYCILGAVRVDKIRKTH